MIKLQQITAFLIGLNYVAAENIDAYIEEPQIVPRCKDIGQGQKIIYTQTYDAYIAIERFPHAQVAAELLFAQVCVWLIVNDETRFDSDLPSPGVDVDVLDSETADIDIKIRFEEDITAVPDENGPIEIDGTKYRLEDAVISYVQQGEMKS